MQKDWQAIILGFFATRSKLFLSLFWTVYLSIAAILLFGSYQILTSGPYFAISYRIGVMFGQLALALLGVVVLPGILGRFRVEIKITRVITLFRRQLGIAVFLLSFSHFMLVRFLHGELGLGPIFNYDTREKIGLLALFLLLFLFLTSNNWSLTHLRTWWKRLHMLIYVILWLVFLHVALYRPSKWAFFILSAAVVEVFSLIYDWWLKRNVKPVQKVSPTPELSAKVDPIPNQDSNTQSS